MNEDMDPTDRCLVPVMRVIVDELMQVSGSVGWRSAEQTSAGARSARKRQRKVTKKESGGPDKRLSRRPLIQRQRGN